MELKQKSIAERSLENSYVFGNQIAHLNNPRVKEEIKENQYFGLNENKTTYQNLQDIVKAELREKFTVCLSTYFTEEGKSQINDLSLHLKKLEKRK